MYEILTMLTDIALGTLAYRMAKENKSSCEALDVRLTALELVVARLVKEAKNVDLVG